MALTMTAAAHVTNQNIIKQDKAQKAYLLAGHQSELIKESAMSYILWLKMWRVKSATQIAHCA